MQSSSSDILGRGIIRLGQKRELVAPHHPIRRHLELRTKAGQTFPFRGTTGHSNSLVRPQTNAGTHIPLPTDALPQAILCFFLIIFQHKCLILARCNSRVCRMNCAEFLPGKFVAIPPGPLSPPLPLPASPPVDRSFDTTRMDKRRSITCERTAKYGQDQVVAEGRFNIESAKVGCGMCNAARDYGFTTNAALQGPALAPGQAPVGWRESSNQ